MILFLYFLLLYIRSWSFSFVRKIIRRDVIRVPLLLHPVSNRCTLLTLCRLVNSVVIIIRPCAEVIVNWFERGIVKQLCLDYTCLTKVQGCQSLVSASRIDLLCRTSLFNHLIRLSKLSECL